MNDFSKLFKARQSKHGQLPWAPRPHKSGFDNMVKETLYGQQYLSITLDEGHEFRKNTKHAAALALVELARIRLIATATPLQTSNQV